MLRTTTTYFCRSNSWNCNYLLNKVVKKLYIKENIIDIMFKKFGLLFIILLVLPISVYASTTLYQGQSTTQDSWKIYLSGVLDNQTIQVRLNDNLYYTIRGSDTIEGINIRVIATVFDPKYLIGVAEIQLTTVWENQCETHTDCDDDNECTVDLCLGYQKNCQYSYITACISGDLCCPSGCSDEDDDDCAFIECEENSECDDFNLDTIDQCVEDICKYTPITNCENKDNSCPNGCFFSHSVKDENADTDCSPDNKCLRHTDCNDGDETTSDYCYAYPSYNIKECIFITNITATAVKIASIPVAVKEKKEKRFESCYLKGERFDDGDGIYYCNGYVYVTQKEENRICIENYECISSKCKNSRCEPTKKSIPEKINESSIKYSAAGIIFLVIIFYLIIFRIVLKKLKN